MGGQWLIPGSCEIRLQLDKASAVSFYISNEELLNYPPYIIVKYDAGFDIYGSNAAAHAYTASLMFAMHMHESFFSFKFLNIFIELTDAKKPKRPTEEVVQEDAVQDTREEVVDPQRF